METEKKQRGKLCVMPKTEGRLKPTVSSIFDCKLLVLYIMFTVVEFRCHIFPSLEEHQRRNVLGVMGFKIIF